MKGFKHGKSHSNENRATGGRFKLELVILIVGFFSPLFIPLVAASGLPFQWKAIISGALAVGIPEMFSIAAIAIMGKPGFNHIKARIFGLQKKFGPQQGLGESYAVSHRACSGCIAFFSVGWHPMYPYWCRDTKFNGFISIWSET